MNKFTQLLLVLLVSVCVVLFVGFKHIEKLNQDNSTLEQTNAALIADNNEKNKTITDMEALQKESAAIDAEHIKEMNRARSNLETLQRGVASGAIGLRVNAKCPAVSTSASQATTGSLGDGTSPGLTDTAQRDYYTLRDRINTATNQINYLQSYIKTICFASSQ